MFSPTEATNWIKFLIFLIFLIVVFAVAVWVLNFLGTFTAVRQWLVHALGG